MFKLRKTGDLFKIRFHRRPFEVKSPIPIYLCFYDYIYDPNEAQIHICTTSHLLLSPIFPAANKRNIEIKAGSLLCRFNAKPWY